MLSGQARTFTLHYTNKRHTSQHHLQWMDSEKYQDNTEEIKRAMYTDNRPAHYHASLTPMPVF